MIDVNTLVQEAYEALGMTGLGESTDGTMSVTAVKQLNRLITSLNQEGYISLAQKYVDAGCFQVIHFKKLCEGEEKAPNVFDMDPPDAIDAVARKSGIHFIPLHNSDLVQLQQKDSLSTPYAWNYGRDVEKLPEEYQTLDRDSREIGNLVLDGLPVFGMRIYLTSKLPTYDLDQRIYLPDAYNELLMSGLKLRLAEFFKLDADTKNDCYAEHRAAKTLIKRTNISQRQLNNGEFSGDWRDSYDNGFAPSQWG